MAIDNNLPGAPRHVANARTRVQLFFVPITMPPFLFASPQSAAREPDRALKIVHSLGGGERPRAACAISLGVEPLGARQGRRERRLRPLLRPFDRGGRRLAVDLRADRLPRHRPGVRVSGGLAHRLLELRDLLAAGAGVRRRKAQAQNGDGDQCSHCCSLVTGTIYTTDELIRPDGHVRRWVIPMVTRIRRTSSISRHPSSPNTLTPPVRAGL